MSRSLVYLGAFRVHSQPTVVAHGEARARAAFRQVVRGRTFTTPGTCDTFVSAAFTTRTDSLVVLIQDMQVHLEFLIHHIDTARTDLCTAHLDLSVFRSRQKMVRHDGGNDRVAVVFSLLTIYM